METGNEAIWHRKEKRFLIFPLQEADPAAGVCSSCSRKTNVSFTAHTGVSAAVLAECSQLTSHVLLSSCYKHGSNTTNVCFCYIFTGMLWTLKMFKLLLLCSSLWGAALWTPWRPRLWPKKLRVLISSNNACLTHLQSNQPNDGKSRHTAFSQDQLQPSGPHTRCHNPLLSFSQGLKIWWKGALWNSSFSWCIVWSGKA